MGRWSADRFFGELFFRNYRQLSTSVYRKPTNTGLLLYFNSHVDLRYKTLLLRTMLNRAYRLSSMKELFGDECKKLRSLFSRLKNPNELVDSTILSLIKSKLSNVSSPSPAVLCQINNLCRYCCRSKAKSLLTS